jgi:CRISPR-associated endonuclease/helicase Cas3
VRFWEDPALVPEPKALPELLPVQSAGAVFEAEKTRIRYQRLEGGRALTVKELVAAIESCPGPRLVILNTVQNAAVVARAIGDGGDVEHLSTALTPVDRGRILQRVAGRLKNGSAQGDWTLVATSCVEAGVDLSFRSAFRERHATASIIQIGGRVNRNAEYDLVHGGMVFDFSLDDVGLTRQRDAALSADILRELLVADELNQTRPSDIVTKALRLELSARGGLGADLLLKAERARNYPSVEDLGRVIRADTKVVVVDLALRLRLSASERVSFHDLMAGSVQLWAHKIQKLQLQPLPTRKELYGWDDEYDAEFLGIMAGVFRNERFLSEGGAVI